jgi:hypothetical protein
VNRRRTKVYDAVLTRLADRGWHETRELEELTHWRQQWLRELTRDPKIEIDGEAGRMRLVGPEHSAN